MAYNSGGYALLDEYGNLIIEQTATTDGVPVALSINGADHSGITASSEAAGLNIDYSNQMTWETGNFAWERIVNILPPTLNAVGASVINNVASLYIDGAPIQGTNMSLGTRYGLYVNDGSIGLDGNLQIQPTATGANHTSGVIQMRSINNSADENWIWLWNYVDGVTDRYYFKVGEDLGNDLFTVDDLGNAVVTKNITSASTVVDIAAPTAILSDYQLEGWQQGTVINMAYGGATSQLASQTGINLDFSTNVTATGFGSVGTVVTLPAVTNVGAGTYVYTGHNVTGGALAQTTLAGTNVWTGYGVTLPATTATTGTINAYGVKVTGGVATSGAQYGLYVDMNADTDSALTIVQGTTDFGGAVRINSVASGAGNDSNKLSMIGETSAGNRAMKVYNEADIGTDTYRSRWDNNSDTQLMTLNQSGDLSVTGTINGVTVGSGDITLSSINPTLSFKDTNATDNDVNASIDAQATDVGSGTEDIDVTFKQQVAGVPTAFITADADGSLTLGTSAQGVIIPGDFTVNGTTTTINSTTLTVDDKNIVMGDVTTPTDITADGGGIELKGATDKTILWDNANDNWTSNQAWNISSGLDYKINNISVLNATTLGSSVVASSLTSVGTLTSLSTTGQITSTLADGTPPFVLTSTTKSTNLNADRVDDVHIDALTDTRLLRYNSTGTKIENATVTETSGALGAITTLSMNNELDITNSGATPIQPLDINYGVTTYTTGDIIADITRTGALTQTSGSNTGITDFNIKPTSALTKITTADIWNYNLANISSASLTSTTDTSSLTVTGLHLEAGTDSDISYRSLWIENGLMLFNHSASTTGTQMMSLGYAGTSYTNNTALVQLGRSGAITLQSNNDTMVDFKVIPNMVLTAMGGAGSATYNGAQIDMRSVSVTASVGTTTVNALRIHAATDTDSQNLAIRATGMNTFDNSSTANLTATIQLQRGTNGTADASATVSDLWVVPTWTLTGPASGTSNYYGIKSDLSSVGYVAGVGSLTTAAIYAKPANNLNTNNYAFYSDGRSRFAGQLVFQGVPTNTTVISFDLASFTQGTLVGASYTGATALAGTLKGTNFDFRTNLTATGFSVLANAVDLPSVTNTGAGVYQYVGYGVDVSGAGTLEQNTATGTDIWGGYVVNMPNATVNFAGASVEAYGLKIVGGTATKTAGSLTYEGIDITMNADADVALKVGKGISEFGGVIKPATNDGWAIGVASTNEWSDLFLAEGGVINWDNNDVTLTQTGNSLALAGGNLSMGDDALIVRDVNAGLTASVTQTQGQGALTAEINEVATVATTNDTVTLITASVGLCQTVINNGANTLQIFPASGDNLGAGADTATTLPAGQNVQYCAFDTTNWESI